MKVKFFNLETQDGHEFGVEIADSERRFAAATHSDSLETLVKFFVAEANAYQKIHPVDSISISFDPGEAVVEWSKGRLMRKSRLEEMECERVWQLLNKYADPHNKTAPTENAIRA